MTSVIEQAVRETGDVSEVERIRAVAGGDINEAFYVRTEERSYFVKMNRQAARDFFECEARGLELLRTTETVAVPRVYFCGEKNDAAVLVLEWIEGERHPQTEDILGRNLALMHQTYGPGFGLDYDNYIGPFPQVNGWHDHWLAFLREQRLGYQAEMAERKGRMRGRRKAKMERLLQRLPEWIPPHPQPSMLHGDLWGGNWIVGGGGTPYLIDPAVFYGHFEFELAFTELFGGYSDRFYDAYREVQDISDEYENRRPLYQLYYLLVHLNAFGEAYGGSVDRVLNRYVGV